MEKEFGIPTRVDNDVRTAALGELNYGAGVGCQNMVCITQMQTLLSKSMARQISYFVNNAGIR